MRDDVAADFGELSLLHVRKKLLLQRLLLNETDKIHYVQSDNPERVSSILLEDDAVIEEIDLVDCEIAEREESLARIIGVTRKGLYGMLQKSGKPAKDLVDTRAEIRDILTRLLRERERLLDTMAAASDEARKSFEEIARIRGLGLPGTE